jgi:hypothetical protein
LRSTIPPLPWCVRTASSPPWPSRKPWQKLDALASKMQLASAQAATTIEQVA